MRDILAGVVALALLLVAGSLATTLKLYRGRRRRLRESESERGRTVIAEIPAGDDLVLFSEGSEHFHYGNLVIDKSHIAAVRVLINGAPIAAYVSRTEAASTATPTSFEDRPDGIARDRWDVAIEAAAGTTLVECGAIRERVSQELARAVFDAVRTALERRDAHI